MSLARLSVRNPVPVNLIMVAIVVLGTLSFVALPRELMPDITLNWSFIITPYPGVSAEEIEKLITIPIENEIRDVRGIDSITSQSAEGSSFISVKFKEMSEDEFRTRVQELRAEVNKVKDLPEDALETDVSAFSTSDMVPLISVHLYGRIGERELIERARQLRDQLQSISRVAKVQLSGARDREIWVEADPGKLQGYALPLQQLQAAIKAGGVNVPAGSLPVGRYELLVRTLGEYSDAERISRVIVRATPEGRRVRVGDLATVRDTLERPGTRSRLRGQPVISMTISKQNTGNSIAITNEVKRLARKFVSVEGQGIDVSFTQDSSEPIVDMLRKLSINAWMGFVVVVLLLLLMVGLRNAILAALGIPISFLACFIFMHNSGESFNGNSLFGLVLVLGIIVDDAIVIVENCYRHLQMGKTWKEAAIVGTEEVTLPILAATATTIAAFLPLILLPGIMGKFMRIVPVVVTLALVASMIEAFLILPSHFADWPGKRFQQRDDKPWFTQLQNRYEQVLRYVVNRRWRFVLGMFLVVPCAGLLIPLVGVDMFSGEEVNTFQVRVTMPTGTNLETTLATLKEFEQAASGLPSKEVREVHTTAGLVITDTDWIFRSDVGQLWLDLPMSYDRQRSTDQIMNDLRQRLNTISGPTQIEFAKVNTGPPVGKPVEVKLKGKYLPQLRAAADQLKAILGRIPGVFDIADDYRAGKQEVQFTVDRERAALYGVSVAEVGLTIRAALDGIKAGRLYDGDEEIEIMVKVAPGLLERPEALLRLPLVLPSGQSVPLGEVAQFRMRLSYAEVRRYKNQRAITVSANVDKSKATTVSVNQQLQREFDQIAGRYSGVTLDFTGEFQEFREAFTNIAQLFLFGVLLIYFILGAQFRSYLQPVVILCTVPFSFVGAMIGLVIGGNPFSIITLFGMVALAGVAVNDAIVLISFANNLRASGVPTAEAVIQAGRLRLRPIILTSATTIAGLLPMGMGLGGMSLTWSPLANTIVWGLGVGTLLTLFLIPAAYLVVIHDLPGILRRQPPDTAVAND